MLYSQVNDGYMAYQYLEKNLKAPYHLEKCLFHSTSNIYWEEEKPQSWFS
jgi:hypothetical protein